jgi:ABC-type branched-subunit amino acid transport system substrate-binding protein
LALSRFASRPAVPPVRLAFEDTQSRPEQATAGVQALAARRVAAIIGPMITAAQAAEEAQRQRIPIVTFTQREEIPAIGEFVFRHFITAQNQTEALVRWAIERRGITRLAVLYPSDKYGRTFLASFAERTEAHGARMVGAVAYDPAGTDFAGPIRELSRLGGFEALFIPDEAAKAALVIPQLAFHGLTDFVLMGTNLWQSPRLIEMADTFVEGAVFPSGFCEADPDPSVAEFIAAFRDAYGQDPAFIEAVAYDTAMILFEILSRPEIRSRTLIRSALAAGTPHSTGLTGETVFDVGGEVYKSLSLITIQGGRFVFLDRMPASPDDSRPVSVSP